MCHHYLRNISRLVFNMLAECGVVVPVFITPHEHLTPYSDIVNSFFASFREGETLDKWVVQPSHQPPSFPHMISPRTEDLSEHRILANEPLPTRAAGTSVKLESSVILPLFESSGDRVRIFQDIATNFTSIYRVRKIFIKRWKTTDRSIKFHSYYSWSIKIVISKKTARIIEKLNVIEYGKPDKVKNLLASETLVFQSMVRANKFNHLLWNWQSNNPRWTQTIQSIPREPITIYERFKYWLMPEYSSSRFSWQNYINNYYQLTIN